MSGLSRLTIKKAQRPETSRRIWLPLFGIVLLVGLIAAGAGYWYYRTTGTNIMGAMAERATEVNVMTVAAPAAGPRQEVVLVANGKIISDRQVNVATKVSGQIVELNVEQGDLVREGDVLARVEDVVYRAQRDEAAANRARSRHAIARAEAELVRSRAGVAEARAAFEFDAYNHDRLSRLQGTRDASEFELVSAKNRHDASAAALAVAEAQVKSSETAIDLARADADAAEAQLRLLQKRLDDCAITAPISGVILERNAQVGDFLAFEGGRGANANAQLVAIADMTLLRVEIDVSERDVHRVFKDQPCRITPDADREATYAGHVMWVDPVGDYARAIVQVKVRIKYPGPNLRVQGSAKVEFLSAAKGPEQAIGGSTERFWLPKSALKLTPGSDQAVVFTETGGRAVAHVVTIGTRTEDRVEVIGGVTAGMRIVAENADALENGGLLKIVRSVAADPS